MAQEAVDSAAAEGLAGAALAEAGVGADSEEVDWAVDWAAEAGAEVEGSGVEAWVCTKTLVTNNAVGLRKAHTRLFPHRGGGGLGGGRGGRGGLGG